MASRLITIGGGCFWCIESVFSRTKGVSKALSGYSGGNPKSITYEEVCSGKTGHAEVVQIEYNPAIINTDKILRVFFAIHDPTQLNRQGNDIGTQYRSVVYYHDNEQKEVVENLIKELDASGTYKNKIVTEITKFDKFFPAEDYHQKYFQNNPNQGYCQAVVRPKYEKFQKLFKDLFV